MPSQSDIWDEILRVQKSQLQMLRFLAFDKIKDVLQNNLEKDSHQRVFEHSTGNSTREVADVAGVSHVTVSTLWEKWAKLGIVVEDEVQPGRYHRICSLGEVGMSVPDKGAPKR